jgi:cytochrome oxidase Cu insertion factor (SCO1/SenC/PrrC family)
MTAMLRKFLPALLLLAPVPSPAETPKLTEASFRATLGVPASTRMEYRGLDCKPLNFKGFAAAMTGEGARADVERAADGSAVTMSVTTRGSKPCPSSYPAVAEMPPFDLKDLAGNRVTSASLRGKPTLVSFYFSRCVPCILEVGPINRFAAARPQMNFLAMTFDDAAETRAFVKRYGLKWRVVPDAQEFIQRMRIKKYPLMALFDANGRLLGTKQGGARDELEAATVEPELKRWTEGLLRK